MGLFGFGGGSSSSSSSGSSFSEDRSRSESESGGVSIAGGAATSRDSIAFEDVFARLFGGASGAAAGLDPSMLTSAANQLFSSGSGFMDSLAQGGPERAYLESRVAGSSPVLDEQIGALSEDIGRFFREEINPAITSEAVAGGALGGGRQGVAQGAASAAAGREFQRGAMSLRAGDIAARDAAAGTLGAQRGADAGTAFAGIPALAGVADMGFGADLAPFAALAGILGGPTVLGSSDSSSFSSSEDFARAFSESFGTSRSETQSRGRSSDFSIGFN